MESTADDRRGLYVGAVVVSDYDGLDGVVVEIPNRWVAVVELPDGSRAEGDATLWTVAR